MMEVEVEEFWGSDANQFHPYKTYPDHCYPWFQEAGNNHGEWMYATHSPVESCPA